MIKVVHLYSGEPYDIYIGRPSIYGNPWSHLSYTAAQYRVRTRKEAIQKFKEHVRRTPALHPHILACRDKTIACWCKPKPCHGDAFEELIRELDNGRWF